MTELRRSPERGARHHHDAVNEVYDQGCDLIAVARALRRAASDPTAGPAVPAVIGCLESALHDLSLATPGLERAVAASIADEGAATNERLVRMRQGLLNLKVALHDAAGAAAAARSLSARALSRPD